MWESRRANAAEGLVVITQIQPIRRFSLPQADLPDVLAAVRSGRSLPVRALLPTASPCWTKVN